MARLQRKKTAGAKKKKRQSVTGASSSLVKSDAVAKKTTSITDSVKEIKKKRTLPQKKALAVAKTGPGKLRGHIDKGLQFLREVKVELKKVTWPTRKQTLGSTVVVIILVMIISLFLGVVDLGLSNVIRVVFQ